MKISVAILALAIAGCVSTGFNPQAITATKTRVEFSGMDCATLAGEKQRIESSYKKLRWSTHYRTIEWLGSLNGQTHAINDAIRMKGCQIASVVIPGDPHVESRNDRIP